MKLIVNGMKVETPNGLTVSALLEHQKVKMPEMVSVELNGQIIKRAMFDSIVLKEGDSVEFLYFMGGGIYENCMFPTCSF